MSIDDSPSRARAERESAPVFPLSQERDATLRLDQSKRSVPPIATSACLDDAFCARIVARMEHRLDLVETSGSLPTGSRRAWRGEVAVVACVGGDDPRGVVLCEAACDAVAHRLWSRPVCWSGNDPSVTVRGLHAHVAAEVERVRERKALAPSKPIWAAALTLSDRLWLLGEGEAIVHVRMVDGTVRTTELHDGVSTTRLDVAELHGVAVALGEACGRLEEDIVSQRLASEDRLDVVIADLIERTKAAGGRRGAWIVARFPR